MLRVIGLIFVVFIKSFSLELSPSDFLKEIENGKSEVVEFELKNNSVIKKEYFFKASEKNVKITPKGFRLNPYEIKKFQVKIENNNLLKGKKNYYLEIDEVIREAPKANSLNLNKKYRIKQLYIVK